MSESPVRAEPGSVESTAEAPVLGRGWSVAPPGYVYLAVEHTEDAVVIEACSSLDEGLRFLVDRIAPGDWVGWASHLPEDERSSLPADVSAATTPEVRRAVLASYWGDPVEEGPERVEYGAGTGAAVYVERREVRVD